MNKKKLVIFMPSIEGGGVEKNFFIVSNYFSKKLKNVAVITTKSKYTNKLHKNIELITPKNIFWNYFSRRTKYFVCSILLIKQILYQKDITVFAFQANLYCVLLCKLFGIKVLTRSNSAPAGWSKNNIKKLIYKFLLSKADGVVVNSIEFKKQMKKYFNVNTRCIFNPLNKNEINFLSKKKVEKIYKKKNVLKIINIGRFVDQKDQITLLKALNLLKNKINFEAVLIGKGKLKYELLRFIIKNNLNKYVKILNFKDNPYPYLKQADMFILSSKYEGLPNVLLESLTLKKFVISSNCPTGPKEILLNGKAGLLFKTKNFKSLSQKINFYVKNKSICKSKLLNGYKSLKRFEFYQNLKKYENFVKPYL